MKFIKLGTNQLAYQDEGQGEVLLLIHGLAGDHMAWEPQVAEWKKRFRVIAADTRGAGQSTQTDEPLTLQDLADDFLALMSELGVERAHVVGRSMGGCIAQLMVLKEPERVASLALLASCGKFDPLALRGLVTMREVLEWTGSWEAHARHSIRNFVSPHFFNEQQLRVKEIERLIGSSTRLQGSYVQQNKAVSSHDVLDRLHEIKCPALIMSGSVDPLGSPLLTRWMLERLPQARHVEFEDASHFFMMEQPERFMGEMGSWFDHVAGSQPGSARTADETRA
jgi:3-oxoadipate enol-lactonase